MYVYMCKNVHIHTYPWLPRWLSSKESNLPANSGKGGSISGWGLTSWRRKWQPTSVFLPGKSHGQRSLVGYSAWGCKESDTT